MAIMAVMVVTAMLHLIAPYVAVLLVLIVIYLLMPKSATSENEEPE